MAEIDTTEPAVFIAGTTVKWKILLSDYLPDDGYTLVYNFKDQSHNSIQVESTQSGDYHYINIPTTTSDDFSAGFWHYQKYVTDGDEKIYIGSGRIEVLTNFESSEAGHDPRTHNEIMLDAIKAVLENRATSDQASRRVADRELRYLTHTDLLQLKDYYEAEYLAEQGLTFQSMGVTFVSDN